MIRLWWDVLHNWLFVWGSSSRRVCSSCLHKNRILFFFLSFLEFVNASVKFSSKQTMPNKPIFLIIFTLRFMSFYTQTHQSYEQFLFSSAYCEIKIATLFFKIIDTNLQICWFSLLSQTCFYFVRSLATPTFAPDLLLAYQSHIYRRAIGQLAMASSSTNLHPSQMKRKYHALTTFTIK